MNRIRLHDESGTRTSSMANRGQLGKLVVVLSRANFSYNVL